MRILLWTVAGTVALLCTAGAQSPTPPAPEGLPIARVVLYKAGVGYFEHLGTIRDKQDVSIRFTSAQLNDVVKSLTAIDLNGGRVTGINYNSAAPLDQRIGALRLPLSRETSLVQVLTALRGARIEVSTPSGSVAGRLLTVERHTRKENGSVLEEDTISLLADSGEVRVFELLPSTRVRLAEPDLRQELGRYLNLVGSSRQQDVRRLVIGTEGKGNRRLLVSYISEVPVWKTTYRLVLPGGDHASQGSKQPFLQGWAVIDNTIGEDWNGVELSLIAGAPQSFIQQISQPYYAQRPVLPLPSSVLLTPQTHAPTLQGGSGRVLGKVADEGGAALPGVEVVMTAVNSGEEVRTTTNAEGRYQLSAPAGTYRIRYGLQGFATKRVSDLRVDVGMETLLDASLEVASLTETVPVSAESAPTQAINPLGFAGGVGGGVYQERRPPGDTSSYLRAQPAAASGSDLGDLFEYRVSMPVTILKNQSALVPIVNADVTAEKVSLWSARAGSLRPLRAVWLTNTTGLTLDGGTFTVIESGAFAGEGLTESMKPGERRFVSYASDRAVAISRTSSGDSSRTVRVRSADGFLVLERLERRHQVYQIRNEDAAPRVVVIEHPVDAGWKLADADKPAETTAEAYRFRVLVGARQEATIDVRETRPAASRVTLMDVTDDQVASIAQSGVSAAALQRELRPLLAKRAEVAVVERRIADLRTEEQRISQDQQRVRENMKALRGSREEKLLLQRYAAQLDAQESRLEILRREANTLSAERERLRADLSRLVQSITIDVGGEP